MTITYLETVTEPRVDDMGKTTWAIRHLVSGLTLEADFPTKAEADKYVANFLVTDRGMTEALGNVEARAFNALKGAAWNLERNQETRPAFVPQLTARLLAAAHKVETVRVGLTAARAARTEAAQEAA